MAAFPLLVSIPSFSVKNRPNNRIVKRIIFRFEDTEVALCSEGRVTCEVATFPVLVQPDLARPRLRTHRTVEGLGLGVWYLGFEVWGLGFWVWGLGFGVRNMGCWVRGLGFGIWGLGFGYRI